ncbi:MAG: hypothetical protein IIC67_11240 [Thaumarchaeota archaeon]|nr:hypothetical protein [Nitrososphaerota archaeon]
MKTRLLIIIGISVVITISSLSYAIYESSTTVFISCDPRYEQIDDKCVLKISETDYEELECLRLYKDIREISRTDGFALAERETINLHKSLVFEYVEKDCPDFPDLEFIYNNYKQNISEPEPERNSAWITDVEDELYNIGCDKPILEHLLKYSNLLDEEFNGKYAIEDIGLPDGVSIEKFEECVDFILEQRTTIELENTEPELEIEKLGNFTLTVSNQSFEISPVDITVQIDGKAVIDRDFEVGSQHNFYSFEFQIAKGIHIIHASSELGDVELEKEFEVDEEKWGYLFYTNDENHLPRFELEISDEGFAFE